MEFLDGFKPVRPIARVRAIGSRALDFGARHIFLPAETDLKTSNHIREHANEAQGQFDFTEADVTRAVGNVIHAFPGAELVPPTPDDAA